MFVREQVADFINKRDNLEREEDKCNPFNVYLCNGASEGARHMMMASIRNDSDGVMVPIPQYPLYSAQLALQKGHLIPYYLDEDKNWAVDVNGIEEQLSLAEEMGIQPRSIVVINPGNPTGQVLTKENIK